MAARRRSSIRTANESLQEQFLGRVRRVADAPSVALATLAEGTDEPRSLAALRKVLGKADGGGGLPFMARFDKGIVGAVRLARQLAQQVSAPRLLDARVDGNRRFFLQRGHVIRLVNLGIQNWDDPLALQLAYGPMAKRDGLWFFAGSRLWCTGTKPTPPRQWFEDLAARTNLALAPDGEGAACPHADRTRLEFRFPAGPALRVCAQCSKRSGHLHGHLLQRVMRGDDPVRPVTIALRTAAGGPVAISEPMLATYRKGVWDEATLIDEAMTAWRVGGLGAARRFVMGARDFGDDQETFLDNLGLAEWERAPARALTAAGHAGESTNPADVLGHHRDSLPLAIDLLLPGDGLEFVRSTGGDVRTVIRLAHEEAVRRERTRDLPVPADLGPLGKTLDGLVRDARVLPRHELLARLRVIARSSVYRAHLYAFLQALGGDPNAQRDFSEDQKEAGLHWTVLAKAVLDASGPAYPQALAAYLAGTGAGEAA